MGKKRKFNSTVTIQIDDTTTKQIVLDPELSAQTATQDSSNQIVLPAQKRKTVKHTNEKPKPLLPKKKRKRLEKIVALKQKKQKRAELLEGLKQFQVDSSELAKYVSLAAVQTKGRKCLTHLGTLVHVDEAMDVEPAVKLTKKWHKRSLAPAPIKKDPNVVGLEESSDDASDEEMPLTSAEVRERQPTLVIVNEKEEKPCPPIVKPSPPVPKPVQPTVTPLSEPVVHVPVHRKQKHREGRLKLPILAEEHSIMEKIKENDIVILAGETGSGKTTQVPQFLYEAGFTQNGRLIGITEPRRVAATSMAHRVAEEMNLTDEVSYQIRYEGNVTPTTQIKFMTEGVLLKEVEQDFLLTKYSAIILDEAHERTAYTDILLGLLSRAVPFRRTKTGKPLKLIIMSATLRVTDFTQNEKLFRNGIPPLITVESRQYEVTVHNEKRTVDDYVDAAYKKVCRIHRELPSGAILVFLTGNVEVNSLVRKLRRTFPSRSGESWYSGEAEGQEKAPESESDYDDDDDSTDKALTTMLNARKMVKARSLPNRVVQKKKPKQRICNLDEYSSAPEAVDVNREDDDLDLAVDEDDEDAEMTGPVPAGLAEPLWVLPLYSLLPMHLQQRVFQSPPNGARLCVIATNIAETSLTIPDIKYVVDSGRVKTKLYDKVTGVTKFHVTYTSKASADQRKGRAGRVAPGHCYRLYSKAVYHEEFPEHMEPDICKRPIEDIVLKMKALGIKWIRDFPLPTPVSGDQLTVAEKKLCLLGALERRTLKPKNQNVAKNMKKTEYRKKTLLVTQITQLGHEMNFFSVAPHFGKMLVMAYANNLLPVAICFVAALSVKEVLIENVGDDSQHTKEMRSKWSQLRRSWAGQGNALLLGDPMVYLQAVGGAEYVGCTPEYCDKRGVRHKAVVEVRKLRQKLTNEANLLWTDLNMEIDPKMPMPKDSELKLLRELLAYGFVDQVAKRATPHEIRKNEDFSRWKNAYFCPGLKDPVFLSAKSVLKNALPEWIAYQELYETKGKMCLRGVTAIEPEWLPHIAPNLCRFSAPMEDPAPRYDEETGKVMCHMKGTYSNSAWVLPTMELEYPRGYDRCRLFASFLLKGTVFNKLGQFKERLMFPATNMVKPWAKLQPAVVALLNALLKEKGQPDISCKEALESEWKKNSSYLLEEYLMWLPEAQHEKVKAIWPPM